MAIAERLAQYKQLTDNISKLENAIEQVKAMRSDVARALRDENGKDQVYDLDGEKVFVSATKIGTFFLAPRKRTRRKAKSTPPPGRVVEVEATLGTSSQVHTSDTVVPGPSSPPPPEDPAPDLPVDKAKRFAAAYGGRPEPVDDEAQPGFSTDVVVGYTESAVDRAQEHGYVGTPDVNLDGVDEKAAGPVVVPEDEPATTMDDLIMAELEASETAEIETTEATEDEALVKALAEIENA